MINVRDYGNRLFLTDGGLETTMIFQEGRDLPQFAAFDLLRTLEGRNALQNYFSRYAQLAIRFGTGLILESATWRASSDWGARIGYSSAALAQANRDAVNLLVDLRQQFLGRIGPIVISGCVGPRGDGYVPGDMMRPQDAECYHMEQVEVLARTPVDFITAMTINYASEAVGIARAARAVGKPVVISFTVESDGNLATGQTLKSAVQNVDDATDGYPIYYMVNCAHPVHFGAQLLADSTWVKRIRGLRANASTKNHAELNECSQLDCGDPIDFGHQHVKLKRKLPHLHVFGGCCGTDHRHVEQIAMQMLA